jgi:methionyl-tRNA formyltransferase
MNLDIGILCSGKLGLSTVEKLLDTFTPQFIFTDKNSDGIIELAQENNIPLFVGNPRNISPNYFLSAFDTDIIFSINYLFIVEYNILKHPKFAINLHGSLLPKYRGRTPHVWAIINGEKETGVTAHIMESGCDTGDIVLQKPIEILPEFTGADILNIYEEMYPKMVLEIIKDIEHSKLTRTVQNNSNATYFGKRTPDDGEINWNWSKERIYNWVRAQSNPYPGAFAYLNGKKVIIDKVSFSEYGFEESMPNGLILKTTPEILVKTANGVIVLKRIRNVNGITFSENEKFENHANRKI